jgi:hypothetical protein
VSASFVSAGAADLICLGVQQTVERLLDAGPNCLVNMAAQLVSINSNRILQALGKNPEIVRTKSGDVFLQPIRKTLATSGVSTIT